MKHANDLIGNDFFFRFTSLAFGTIVRGILLTFIMGWHNVKQVFHGPILLTWFEYNTSMDKLSYTQYSVGWNYVSGVAKIAMLQRTWEPSWHGNAFRVCCPFGKGIHWWSRRSPVQSANKVQFWRFLLLVGTCSWANKQEDYVTSLWCGEHSLLEIRMWPGRLYGQAPSEHNRSVPGD